ncbi:MAG: ABC transporter ATP-binding protein [Chlamydiia bacterium]|nr:ABC transporter ATP-binding protein [Chlamydiia bacterium]
MLEIENLNFSFSLSPVLNDLTLSLKPKETVALIGASGSGKTTLLRLISGALKPGSGKLIAPMPQSQAYMSQKDLLLPWRTVEANIALPLELAGKTVSPERLHTLLDQLELTPYRHRFPHELSGGQYKRAMLARTLAPEKPLLLLDEPFSSLDLPLRDKLYGRLKSFSQAATLLVTHDFRDAFTLADRILLLKNGQITQSWQIDPDKRENPSYIGTLFQELKSAIS